MNDEVTENYGWDSSAIPSSQRRLYERLMAVTTSFAGQRVLDLGCGNGYLCGKLADRGLTVVGMDADRKGIDIASSAHPKVRFLCTSLSGARVTLQDERFDIVVCSEVVEHLYSPALMTEIASAVLDEAGILIVSTPYHGFLKNLALSVMNAWDRHHNPLREGGHIKFWSRDTLYALLERGGFDVIRFEGVGRAPYFWKSMILVAKKTAAQSSQAS